MSRLFKLTLIGVLFALGTTLSIASSATANSGGYTLTKCQFDCASALSPVENPLAGTDFDFEIGVKAVLDDISLTVKTPGNVYIVGDIQSTGLVRLNGQDLYIDADIFAESLKLIGSDFPRIYVDTPSVLTAMDLDLGSGFMSPTATITTFGSDLGIVDDVLGEGATDPIATTYRKYIATGDVYIDVSMVKLDRLLVDAGGSIVLGTDPAMMIPEPSSALLIGLGLAGMAASRLRGRR